MHRLLCEREVEKKVPRTEQNFPWRITGKTKGNRADIIMNDMTGAGRPRSGKVNDKFSDRGIAGDPNAQIAKKLRALYVSVQEEAIPDRFLDLLEKLDAAELMSAAGTRDKA